MKFFILGAGYGTRLFPFSSVIPKVLLPVGEKPCIRWIVDTILKQGFKDIFICCLDKDFKLFKHEFRDAPNIQYITSIAPEGSAGQFEVAVPHLNEDFIVWYGDDLLALELADLIDFHEENKSEATLVLSQKVSSEFGVVHVNRSEITAFDEKPYVGKNVWTGVAMFNMEMKKYLGSHRDFARDVFPEMLKDGRRLKGFLTDSQWFDVGNIASYMKVNELALKRELEL